MSNKKYWDLTPQTGVTENDLLTFAKQDGSDFITSYISLEDFLSSISQDANVNLGPVLDNTVSDPSTLTPNDGDRYIVASGATGAWSANTNSIAQWDSSDIEWQFYTPVNGDRTIVTTGVNAGKIYEFNGTSWNEVILPVTSATPFFLAGTTVDAGSNKTSRIARTGSVIIGSTNTSLNSKLVVNGNTLSNAYVSRNGYASTSDITRTGNWYRVMSFDCNYSVFAAQHYKFIMAFNGNSDGSGFNAEMDVLIKRQNNQIFISSNITQSKNGTELVYDTDKNIEFLWNNTTKRVTMYFRPDINFSSLSFTILTPRDANNRFTFLNQYTAAADLSGEVSNAFTEKYVIIGNTLGNDFGSVSSKTKLFDETSQNTSIHLQGLTQHLFATGYGDGSFQSSMFLNPESFQFGVGDSVNGLSNNVQLNTTMNYFNLYDSNNAIGNSTTQNVGASQETITDSNTGQYTDVFRDTTGYQIGVVDGGNLTASGVNLSALDTAIYASIEDGDKSGQIRVESEAIVSTVDDKSTNRTSTVTQTYKDFTLRFEDTNFNIDNTIAFEATELILPDGYDIKSDLQNSIPDVISFISVGDSNAQGSAIKIVAEDTVNTTISTVLVEASNTRISAIDNLNSQESNLVIGTNGIELNNNITSSIVNIGEDISINSGSGKIYLNQLPVYANDAAADADVNLASGALYKLTGSRAVYQKP